MDKTVKWADNAKLMDHCKTGPKAKTRNCREEGLCGEHRGSGVKRWSHAALWRPLKAGLAVQSYSQRYLGHYACFIYGTSLRVLFLYTENETIQFSLFGSKYRHLFIFVIYHRDI